MNIKTLFTDGCSANFEIANYNDKEVHSSIKSGGFCVTEKGKAPTADDPSFSAQFNIAKGSFTQEFHKETLKNGTWDLYAYVVSNGQTVYSEPVELEVIAFRTTISINKLGQIFYNGCELGAIINDYESVDKSFIEEVGFCVAEDGKTPTANDICVSAYKSEYDADFVKKVHDDGITDGTWTIRAYVKFDGQYFYSDSKSFTIDPIEHGFKADGSYYYGDHTYAISEDFDPNNYDPVNVYGADYYNYVTFSNIPSDYREFETVYKDFLGKHINGIIALQIMSLEIYNRDREDGTKCFMLINAPLDKNTILERVSHRYDNANAKENQPYLAAIFLQGAERTNFFTPTEPYTIKFQADPDGKKSTSTTGSGDVFYVDVIAEGFQSQKVKRCQVVLWERNVVNGGYYEMHEWSSFVLTAPNIYGDDASKWPGLK